MTMQPGEAQTRQLATDGAGAELRVLYATDGSADAEAALQLLALLPLTAGSAVQVVTVTEGAVPHTPPWYLDVQQDWAEKVTAKAQAGLSWEGVTVTTSLRTGSPALEILRAAEEFGADMIVVGSQGTTPLEAFFLGSVARNVAKHARCAVLVGRAPEHGLRRLVLAVDESEHATDALRFVARLPLPAETQVMAAHAVRLYDPFPGLVPDDPGGFHREVNTVRRSNREHARELVQEKCRQLEVVGKQVAPYVLEGDPAAEILTLARDQQADLIVLGARGVSLIKGLLVGSVADRVLNTACCSVLLVHGREEK